MGLGTILCKLGRHDDDTNIEHTRDGPAPGIMGGMTRWGGVRWRCRRCGKVTLDWTYPPWATKEACEWWEGRPFAATWAEGTEPEA